MKKLLGIVVLCLLLTNLSQADDIRDFQIEGMSLYDSALDYFSKSKITASEADYYPNKKYTTATINSSKFKKYQDVQISYKTNDTKFILLDINGIVDKNYKECLKEIKSIAKDFDDMFSNTRKRDLETYSHWQDKSGESKISDMLWKFSNGDLIVLACYNWNTKFGKKNKFVDELRITIGSKEFDAFLISLN